MNQHLAVVYSRACVGMEAPLVQVETHLSNGLPGLAIVGLPETAVKESKERVRSALINSGYEFPARRITINLAPADLPKQGGRYDLPIALGILAASEQLDAALLADREFIGELALSGELRPVTGILPASLAVAAAQRRFVTPTANVAEARIAAPGNVAGADSLLHLCNALNGEAPWAEVAALVHDDEPSPADLADVMGQWQARRALEIAAAGNHNLLLVGPPGSGKTLLAKRLPGILPDLSEAEWLEVASVQSVAGQSLQRLARRRPFKSPHHTSSAVALVGGGSHPKPGEISLAHRGVLFLDELPEFDRKVLEVLREPLENGEIDIARAAQRVRYPARFQLVAAMNPCPCGYLGHPKIGCTDTPEAVQRYQAKLSGPLLDRIDLHVSVPPLPVSDMINATQQPNETSAAVRARVMAAQAQQQGRQGHLNSALDPKQLQQHAALPPAASDYLQTVMERFGISMRAWHRILRVSRTIADLAGDAAITQAHVAEAVSLRQLDRRAWLQ